MCISPGKVVQKNVASLEDLLVLIILYFPTVQRKAIGVNACLHFLSFVIEENNRRNGNWKEKN